MKGKMKRSKKIMKTLLGMMLSPVSILMPVSCAVIAFEGLLSSASVLPSPESVMNGYIENPYIEFYEGKEGVAWTTVHPGAYAASTAGTYVYTDTKIYRGTEGMTVIPEGVVGRKEAQGGLKAGQHYYEGEITDSVIPVGKWVLSHSDARCVHGPFSACRDEEYFGINGLSNVKCGLEYDSGWIAYCADCGKPITGFVYTNDICVGKIGYVFAGTGEFAKKYPVHYLFVCPRDGDNLENDVSLGRHMCKCFVSYNRYMIRYNGNGALYGEMPDSVFYFGGSSEYEGANVTGEDHLRDNGFINPGFVFAGWSDTPDGELILPDGAERRSIEERFECLSGTGDEVNDSVITLYAVWVRSDCTLLVRGGSFGDSRGSYDGIENGTYVIGHNRFDKGYMYETVVDPSLLGHPKGYRIELNTMGGPGMDPVYTDTVLTGWRFESTDPEADGIGSDEPGMIGFGGSASGSVKDLHPNGRFTYVHSSETDGNIDTVTAEWESASVTLPEAAYRGYVFDGWYTSPDMDPDHFAGKGGDLFFAEGDTVLYACFRGLEICASPDYMGNESFGAGRYDGLTHLTLPGIEGYDLYRYYISAPGRDNEWIEAVTGSGESASSPEEKRFDEGGSSSRYVVPRTGIYSLEICGAPGASYGSYDGDYGEYSSCDILLTEGDVLDIYIGIAGVCESEDDGVICRGGEGSYIALNGRIIMSGAGGKGADHILNVEKEYAYTGRIETFVAETEGDYTLEVWGARGSGTTNGFNTAGNGGYARGDIHLEEGTVLYVVVGGTGGYNGGGRGGYDAYGKHGGSGGGATHISASEGLLSDLSGSRDDVFIVAGGGGGSGGSGASSGSGGGLEGGKGISPWPGGQGSASGGTQTGPGTGGWTGKGGFGYGGSAYSYNNNGTDYPMITNGGGGGGWYGGCGGIVGSISYGCGGGGGSGYIGGVEDGVMANGVCGGDGHAAITCSINIQGMEASGKKTAFYSEGLIYRDHIAAVYGDASYPDPGDAPQGYCIITEPSVRYHLADSKLIYSPDMGAPDPVSSVGLDYDESSGRIIVHWQMPDDNGTDYSYMARAYRAEDIMSGADAYAQTDRAELRITTGVYEYYYIIDELEYAEREYITQNGERIFSSWAGRSGTSPDADFRKWFEKAPVDGLECRAVSFVPDGTDKYIHIVCADRAGNLSTVFNMAVDGRRAHIPYPVITGKLVMMESENVYRSRDEEDTYYVRADSVTPFYLDHRSAINGYARDGYQICRAYFSQNASEYAEFVFPLSEIGPEEQAVASDSFSRTAAYYPGPVSDANGMRGDYGRTLSFTGGFTLSHEGELYIYPGASALLEDGRAVRSDPEKDRMNGLTLIGDSTPPECYVSVNGGSREKLSECNISNVLTGYVIDRRQENVTIELCVSDWCSGAKGSFEISVVNLDNDMVWNHTVSGDSYSMELKMAEDSKELEFENLLFNGDFIITVTSEDNVGNKGSVSSAGVIELDVSGSIHRCLDELTGPADPSGEVNIKRGESGYVSSDVWGYPDAVLVSFEDEKLCCYDTFYVAEGRNAVLPPGVTATEIVVPMPGYVFEAETQFTIPLDYDSNVVKVKITAFRDGSAVTWETECTVISEGTVLDELMTVLR